MIFSLNQLIKAEHAISPTLLLEPLKAPENKQHKVRRLFYDFYSLEKLLFSNISPHKCPLSVSV